MVVEPGQTGPLHVGAVALVLLAYAPPEVVDAALVDVVEAAAHPSGAAADRRRRFAQDDGLTFPGATTLAAPVLRDDGIVAALGCGRPGGTGERALGGRARRALRRATGHWSVRSRPTEAV